MRIQTRGNSTNVWLSSDVGVIDGTMTMSAPTLEKILQAVNEKYGTSFEGWSQLPTVYEVGDTVPNWNAYEKIFITIKYKVQPAGNTNWAIGEMKDNKFYLYVAENPHLGNCGVDDEGIVTMVFLNIEMLFNQIWKPAFMAAGVEVATYETKFEYNVGDTIEDWADYIAI